MYQPVALYIGLRYMRGRASDRFSQFVSWLSTIGIILGVMALVTVLSVMNGFEQEQEKNTLGLMPHALVTTKQGNLNPQEHPASQLKSLSGVSRIEPLTTGDVILQSVKGLSVGVMLGINQEDNEPLAGDVYGASVAQLEPGSYRVILGEKLAEKLGIRLGEQVRLMVTGASQFTPMGRIPSQRLFTVIGTFAAGSEVDATQLLVNQQDASRLMRYPIGNISGWRLYLQKPLNIVSVSEQALPDGLVMKDWRERKGELFQAVRMEKNMMGLLIGLIIAVAAFNIVTSLSLLVMEKQGEVAILKTLGLKRHQIMYIFIVQGASAGIIGALLGSGLGIALSSNLNALMPFIGQSLSGVALPVVIDYSQVMTIALFSMGLALLSTLYPSWRAAAVQPAEALRYE
ncbi:lipoprotein-releasing ABC transporter permease subunit LolC [Pragia fontium]|uniref:Lipoprotein-releasing system permease protein n=2 Tax=Pragia fontium TaxID=82985 RepID=A0AAJ4W9A7_9GAMM|nr:lipoprotein-releasing ABC transporter permease subunit LolC [Pragia fontium]AKJ42036.1 outer membrane-specific lipoprotein transporter subunit LolC [Pragia fontium]GKX61933.1 transporter [Pragia fontium]SFC46388.1 lipoprotein-releasing system permease protein [Pragia fontium DSM 5563 = ATCC 49100]VEJ55068.1 Lipoprotein-releasing system transmembrane protein lolC [Pragia fontium]